MAEAPFKSVTRVAIEEMIRAKGEPSKFGTFIGAEDLDQLVDDLLRLVETSRNLKAQGDRYLSGGQPARADIRRSVKAQ